MSAAVVVADGADAGGGIGIGGGSQGARGGRRSCGHCQSASAERGLLQGNPVAPLMLAAAARQIGALRGPLLAGADAGAKDKDKAGWTAADWEAGLRAGRRVLGMLREVWEGGVASGWGCSGRFGKAGGRRALRSILDEMMGGSAAMAERGGLSLGCAEGVEGWVGHGVWILT